MKRTSQHGRNVYKRTKQDIPDLKKYKCITDHQRLDASVNHGITASAECTVMFRDLENALINEINKCGPDDFLFVSVAWLTNVKLLDSLNAAKARNTLVLAVVQKEDFLRPDTQEDDFKKRLHKQYSQLGSFNTSDSLELMLSRFFELGVPNHTWGFDDETLQDGHDVAAVRCVGNHNQDKLPSFPRMHNKFVVFGKRAIETKVLLNVWKNERLETDLKKGRWELIKADKRFQTYSRNGWIAEKVWTGSFNFSTASVKSFENALLIKNVDIATAYAKEFVLLFLLSEPLNWESTWMAPTFTFQT